MAFTAHEMIVAISNSDVDSYLENRFERASFAAWLSNEYGADNVETAGETLNWLTGSEVWFEDGPVTSFYRDLMEYRAQAARELEDATCEHGLSRDLCGGPMHWYDETNRR